LESTLPAVHYGYIGQTVQFYSLLSNPRNRSSQPSTPADHLFACAVLIVSASYMQLLWLAAWLATAGLHQGQHRCAQRSGPCLLALLPDQHYCTQPIPSQASQQRMLCCCCERHQCISSEPGWTHLIDRAGHQPRPLGRPADNCWLLNFQAFLLHTAGCRH
jgi:hypothetical protein